MKTTYLEHGEPSRSSRAWAVAVDSGWRAAAGIVSAEHKRLVACPRLVKREITSPNHERSGGMVARVGRERRGNMVNRAQPRREGLAQPRGRIFELGGKRYWTFSVGIGKDSGEGASLTPAERLTAWYVAQGLTNEEVARRRGVAPRTVANQVASILRRSAAHSRSEIGRVLFHQGHETEVGHAVPKKG
jgi:DNA-binding CsgD family transcriptional regulator